jgi:hypothetical protein
VDGVNCADSDKIGIPIFYGGIDIAKHQHAVCILNYEGLSVLQLHARAFGQPLFLRVTSTLNVRIIVI